MNKISSAACALAAFAIAGSASAERADREKPINLEAASISVDEVKKVQIFEGSVVLTQGTLTIRAERIVVTQDEDGFQRGVATSGGGKLARFRQKREGRDEYVEGEAERIEHDARNEKTEFFQRAWIRSGLDEVKGNYISYNALSEQYLVTSGLAADGRSPVRAAGGRVRAIIQPKGKSAGSAPADGAAPLILRQEETPPAVDE